MRVAELVDKEYLAGFIRATRRRMLSMSSTTNVLMAGWNERTIRVAVGLTPLIVLGGSSDIAVVWSTPFPGDDYLADVSGGSGLLGRADVAIKPGTQTAAGLTVTVTAALAVTAGSQFVVSALR